jgi:16S rRNA G966 N2-methylase RsmD
LAKAKFKEQAVVICSDFTEALESYKDIRFDIAYIDPPYNKNLGILSMDKISEYDLINENGIIIMETDDIEHIPNEVGRYKLINSKKYR